MIVKYCLEKGELKKKRRYNIRTQRTIDGNVQRLIEGRVHDAAIEFCKTGVEPLRP